jgi:5-methylcytosine-specific restriction endonuclease McrA
MPRSATSRRLTSTAPQGTNSREAGLPLAKTRKPRYGARICTKGMMSRPWDLRGRNRWQCQKCRSLENLQVHHKVKRRQLGNNSLDNLVTVLPHG